MQGAHLYLICGLFGVIAHTLLRYRSLSTDAKKANTILTLRQFLAFDWLGIALSCLAVLAWFLLFGEAADKYPALHGWARTSFCLMGFSGSYIIQQLDSRSKKTIRHIIDIKTDKADGVQKDNELSDQ
jgi:hypothetical protein